MAGASHSGLSSASINLTTRVGRSVISACVDIFLCTIIEVLCSKHDSYKDRDLFFLSNSNTKNKKVVFIATSSYNASFQNIPTST